MIYYVAGIPYSAELYHHGVKGQKWGTRKYQNEDGSLTQAGRQHYGVGSSNDSKSSEIQKAIDSIKSMYGGLHDEGTRQELDMITSKLKLGSISSEDALEEAKTAVELDKYRAEHKNKKSKKKQSARQASQRATAATKYKTPQDNTEDIEYKIWQERKASDKQEAIKNEIERLIGSQNDDLTDMEDLNLPKNMEVVRTGKTTTDRIMELMEMYRLSSL